MDKAESAELVRGVFGCNYDDVSELVQDLEYLPLALAQATAFMLGNSMARNTLPPALSARPGEIKEHNSYGADFLSLMAFLDRNGAHEALLRQYHAELYNLDFEKACGYLKAFSLANESFVGVSPPEEREHWKVQIMLRNQGDESSASLGSKANLLHNATSCFRDESKKPRSCTDRPTLEVYKPRYGRENLETLNAMRYLAALQWIQGWYNEARELEVQVVETSKGLLGSKHSDTPLAMCYFAITCGCQGRDYDAAKLQEEIHEAR
ncbi:hypothetical protein AJ80_06252 [Polytolypa hystricis UAMH7299]|uniref:Uncharacterized protein n=1 Tax=Polytolypa hystricis (strain UAMH7299) TaxID=1447883 RepID=A0A2B7XX69_POLH7|nr:hypothetical protein AJ80_06252 [Polytolypa hystricis UAMH7299]